MDCSPENIYEIHVVYPDTVADLELYDPTIDSFDTTPHSLANLDTVLMRTGTKIEIIVGNPPILYAFRLENGAKDANDSSQIRAFNSDTIAADRHWQKIAQSSTASGNAFTFALATLTGGGPTALDGLDVTGIPLNTTITVTIDDSTSFWQLQDGTPSGSDVAVAGHAEWRWRSTGGH